MKSAKIQEKSANEINPFTVIIVVDEDIHLLQSLIRGVSLYGYNCKAMTSLTAAIEFLREQGGDEIHVILVDVENQASGNLKILRQLRELRPELPMIAIGGLKQTVGFTQMQQKGLYLMQRPFSPVNLNALIQRALSQF